MSARKKRRAGQMSQSEKENMKTTALIKDSLNHSSWRGGFLQDASETEDFESAPKVVKFLVVKKREESHAEKEDLMSFEAVMLPHLNAAHNLAKWLLRNEQDAQDVVQEAFLRALKSFAGFNGSNGRAWLLTIVRNASYTLLKESRVSALTTPFGEQIHASGHESVTPATILEHSEDAELIKEAMEGLPSEFREILTLRHQESLSYKEIADIAQIPPGTVMSRLARARAKLKECLAARIGKEKLDELRRSYKPMDGYLNGELDSITNQRPRCGPMPERGVFCKDKGRKAATPKQELRKITATRALIRRISGIKSSRISKDRCEATCQITKPKTNIMSDYISHDDEHDGINRGGFLHCTTQPES